MTNRKTLTKTVLAGLLAVGTLGSMAAAPATAQAGDFRFSWQTPHGTFVIGPNHPGGHFQPRQERPRYERPRHEGPRYVEPVRHQIHPRQARRILRHAGFRDIMFLRERPNAYVFEARGYRGYRMVAVNKWTGEIIWRGGHG